MGCCRREERLERAAAVADDGLEKSFGRSGDAWLERPPCHDGDFLKQLEKEEDFLIRVARVKLDAFHWFQRKSLLLFSAF